MQDAGWALDFQGVVCLISVVYWKVILYVNWNKKIKIYLKTYDIHSGWVAKVVGLITIF